MALLVVPAAAAHASSSPGQWHPSLPTRTAVVLSSAAGDPVGGGRSYSYTKANAFIAVDVLDPSTISVAVSGDENWSGYFSLPNGEALRRGTFPDATNVNGTGQPMLIWSGINPCTTTAGWFAIDRLVRAADGTLRQLDVRFAQRCDGNSPELRGAVRWLATDKTQPAGPTAIPKNLWAPPKGTTPKTGTYAYLADSTSPTPVSVTRRNALVSFSAGDRAATFTVEEDRRWDLTFIGMEGQPRLKVGYYPLGTDNNPVLARISEGGCIGTGGWFAIDTLRRAADGSITLFAIRFERRCDNGRVLRGALKWDAADQTALSGPGPIPANAWRPAPGATPAGISYLYAERTVPGASTTTELITKANGLVDGWAPPNELQLGARSDHRDIQIHLVGIAGMPAITTGYYPDLRPYGSSSVVHGSLDLWGLGCITQPITGWVAIDSIQFDGPALTSVALRAEQTCGDGEVVHVAFHWDVNDPTQPPGPEPIPADLWAPSTSDLPSGPYLVVDTSSPDPDIPPTHDVYDRTGYAVVPLSSGVEAFQSVFIPMASRDHLEPGFYPNARQWPGANPARPGINWTGGTSTCSDGYGWFAVDRIEYGSDGTVAALDLRFQWQCEPTTIVTNGAIHWVAP